MAIHKALMKGDYTGASNLIASGSDVNGQDSDGRTPLMICCLHDGQRWAVGVSRMLLIHRAMVGHCDKRGRNALIYAVLYEREELVKLFLDALDYDVNHADKDGCRALWYSAASGNARITKMIVMSIKKYDLGIDMVNKDGFTPLMHACRLGHTSCADILRSFGKASDHIKDKVYGRTAKEWEIHRSKIESSVREGIIHDKLPYKSLPADIWDKRYKFYSNTGQKNKLSSGSGYNNYTNTADKNKQSSSLNNLCSTASLQKGQLKSYPVKKVEVTGCGNSMARKDWRDDFRTLYELLEIQSSPSYRPNAKVLPLRKKLFKRPWSESDKHSKQRNDALPKRRNTRKFSLDDLYVLSEDRPLRQNRRRNTVAVIPLTTSARLRKSSSKRTKADKKKSVQSPDD